MAIPQRRSSPGCIVTELRTFFVTSSIAGKRNLLQSHPSAQLFVNLLYHYRSQRKYLLHAFVIMPDHFHLLITVGRQISIERAVQFIKGGFAFRAGRELEFRSPVWKRGFSESRVYDFKGAEAARAYIEENPVKRRLCLSAAEYPYSSANHLYELDDVPQGLKPRETRSSIGTTEVMP